MIRVLLRRLIHKMAKFSDPSNPGSLVSTKGSDVQAVSARVWGIKDVMLSGVLGLLGVGRALRGKIISFGKEQTFSSMRMKAGQIRKQVVLV